MGIIRAFSGAMGSVMEEQWKEIFSCDSMDMNTLMRRGTKLVSDRSANTRKDDNVLTNGSLLLVADGQCVIVVSQGRIVDVCAEPGEHIFQDSSQPGGVKGFLGEVGRRVAFGGGDIQTVTHRVYYVNMKECMGVPFSTPAPVPFRMSDRNTTLDMDASVMLGGMYSYRVSDPVKLYKLLIGNIEGTYTRDRLSGQMTSQLLTCLQTSFSRLSALGLRPYQLPEHTDRLREALRETMSGGWCGEHGLEIVSLSLSSFRIPDAAEIRALQQTAVLRDRSMASAVLTGAAASAVKSAASNRSGNWLSMALMGKTPEQQEWICRCGTVSKGKFCPECGRKRPAEWICSCGQKNTGSFCTECGSRRTEDPRGRSL